MLLRTVLWEQVIHSVCMRTILGLNDCRSSGGRAAPAVKECMLSDDPPYIHHARWMVQYAETRLSGMKAAVQGMIVPRASGMFQRSGTRAFVSFRWPSQVIKRLWILCRERCIMISK